MTETERKYSIAMILLNLKQVLLSVTNRTAENFLHKHWLPGLAIVDILIKRIFNIRTVPSDVEIIFVQVGLEEVPLWPWLRKLLHYDSHEYVVFRSATDAHSNNREFLTYLLFRGAENVILLYGGGEQDIWNDAKNLKNRPNQNKARLKDPNFR